MTTGVQTVIKRADAMAWSPMPEHIHLFHREIMSVKDADRLRVGVSSVLWERIGSGGVIKPHYHDVVEVIHIIVGKVKVLCNGNWTHATAGDTIHVPSGVVHAVENDDITSSEQISIFLPQSSDMQTNQLFKTYLTEVISS